MTRVLARAFQIAVSLALLVWVFRSMDAGEALAALGRLRPLTVALALTLSLAAYAARAHRWTLLMHRAGLPLGAGASYRLTLLGVFYGIVTPGRVGELARVLHLDVPRAQALPSVLWDRLADVMLLELLALPGFFLVPAWRGPMLWAYLLVVAATAVLVLALDNRRAMEWLERRVPRGARVVAAWRAGATGVLGTPAFRRGLWAGLGYYALTFAGAWVLVRELVPAGPPALVLTFPIVPLLGNLPIAFGGLGLREQVTASLFKGLGASVSAGPVFSLVWFAVATLVPGLLGLALVHGPWARAAAPAPDGRERAPDAAGGRP